MQIKKTLKDYLSSISRCFKKSKAKYYYQNNVKDLLKNDLSRHCQINSKVTLTLKIITNCFLKISFKVQNLFLLELSPFIQSYWY